MLKPESFAASSGAGSKTLDDGSLLVTGPVPKTDAYTVTAKASAKEFDAVRLEVLTDPSLPGTGPGRRCRTGTATSS